METIGTGGQITEAFPWNEAPRWAIGLRTAACDIG